MSLIELSVAVALTTFIVLALIQFTASTLRIDKVVTTRSSLQTQARRGIDQLMQDIQGSAGVAASYGGYTSTNVDTSSSSYSETLILRAPSYNAQYQQIAGSSDYIVYRVVASGSTKNLVRRVFPATGSARTATSDTVVARGIKDFDYTCLAYKSVIGTGLLTIFSLDAPANLTSADGPDESPEVTRSGNTVTLTSSALTSLALSSPVLVLASPPSSGEVVEITYPVSPSASAVTMVSVQLTLQNEDASLRPTEARPLITLTASGALRNR